MKIENGWSRKSFFSTLFLRFRLAIVIYLALFLTCREALAWGHVGHAVVADIAELRLSPAAAAAVRELLAVEHHKHLSDISSWADDIKSEHLSNSPAHSIRLPLDHSSVINPGVMPSGYWALDGIRDYYKILADKTLPLEQREIALKYLVHLVGDLHQPLHASVETGSKIPVTYDGKSTFLHVVWDSSIIDDHTRDAQLLANQLMASPNVQKLKSGGDATDWAFESRDIARDYIYSEVPLHASGPIQLPNDYDRRKWPIIEDRLTQAGIRLANLLNSALG